MVSLSMNQVADSLAHYQAPELLTGECQYYCDACNGKRDATRRIVLTKVPRVLFVQLMRYEYNKVLECVFIFACTFMCLLTLSIRSTSGHLSDHPIYINQQHVHQFGVLR